MSSLKKRVIAKKRTSEVRKPRFICSAHPSPLPMVYNAERARWVCSDPNCVQTRRPHQDPGEVMSIRSTPKLVLREDEDGDIHAFLFWQDFNIMVSVPYANSRTLPSNNGGETLFWDFSVSEVETLDKEGNPK